MNGINLHKSYLASNERPRCAIGLILVMLLLLLATCTPVYLSEEELKAYVLDADNELMKVRDYKNYSTKVTYRPTDLLIAQETHGATVVDSSALYRLKSKYQDYYYFILSLSKNNKEAHYQSKQGFGQFSDVVQTLSFRMADYVNLTTSAQDTIRVADYVFPRTYGMGGATNLMFVFNREKTKGKEWLQFNLSEFGMGLGNQNFRFSIKDLENAPKIDWEVRSPKMGVVSKQIQ